MAYRLFGAHCLALASPQASPMFTAAPADIAIIIIIVNLRRHHHHQPHCVEWLSIDERKPNRLVAALAACRWAELSTAFHSAASWALD